MKIGIFNYHDVYNKNNALFNRNTYAIGEDLEYPFVVLRNELAEMGHSLDTLDQYPIEEYDKVIFLDFPNPKKISLPKLKSLGIDLYLVTLESPMIRPENMAKENLSYFKKVFTWDDSLVDNQKYFKINFSFKLPRTLTFDGGGREKLCVMIAGNKVCNDCRELYSERRKAIDWFEKKHPDEFDLYGFGWNEYRFKGIKLIRALNHVPGLTKFLGKKYKVYKGRISSKNEILKKYKFSICYENGAEMTGYITEKIFDCFFSGCVPIYLGAPNILDHIPSDCFIDKENFKTYEELYEYLHLIPDAVYDAYLVSISNFLKSESVQQFSGTYFARCIAQNMLN